MWSKIRGNTIMFIMIVGFVKAYGMIFTPTNTIVGVTTIIAILVLLQENLTKNAIENLTTIIVINIVQGIFSFISFHNMGLGLILNFIMLLSIGYLFSSKLSKVLVIPFGLQYLFMLYSPIVSEQLPLRILALGVGAFLVMAVQFMVHKKDAPIETLTNKLIDFKSTINIHEYEVRSAYALRIALITSLSAFVVAYFEIHQGRWVVYTVFALTELYSEHCQIKSKQRLHGTLIGALIALILFAFIKDNVLRTAVILIGGYLDSYTTNYRDKIICVTVTVIASVSLTQSTLETVLQRILFVLIGIILALIVDKLIYRRNLSKTATSYHAS